LVGEPGELDRRRPKAATASCPLRPFGLLAVCHQQRLPDQLGVVIEQLSDPRAQRFADRKAPHPSGHPDESGDHAPSAPGRLWALSARLVTPGQDDLGKGQECHRFADHNKELSPSRRCHETSKALQMAGAIHQ
jgi:hypothetical protein